MLICPQLFWAPFWDPIWAPFYEPDLSFVGFSVLESAPECLKAGGSCERLFQGASEIRTGGEGGGLQAGLAGAQLPLPDPPPAQRRKERE